MKFVLADEYTFWWPVTVRTPDPDKSGQIAEQSFEGRFKALADDRVKALAATRDDDELQTMIRESLVDWRDVQGPDGKDVPFSGEALAQALRFPFFRLGVFAAIVDASSGKAAEKN
ncbi:hypothetical protein [Oricola indica]|uniref:hypothetical protein n=1 Tax=Oricola indica TaxID=2872591 RepID=UPI003CCBB896